ncbi:pilus assembly protein N-terminal domain-containing protein, partial [Vibrio vulnificus]
MKKTLMCLLITTIGFVSSSVNSNELMNLNQGAAKTISLKRQISTVFVGDPEIADYKIIDETKVVVYGVGLGATSVIVYDR